IFSLLVGGTLFGFVGLLLAIPVAAVAKGLFVYFFEKHTRSKLTSGEGALFRERCADEADEADEAGEADEECEPGSTDDEPKET
ncbi:MAG: hypothetical protein Q8K89_09860, partial [Actinomycetota bacterium]|nr:hypothetical protein [Actinomycetota bacterium]